MNAGVKRDNTSYSPISFIIKSISPTMQAAMIIIVTSVLFIGPL